MTGKRKAGKRLFTVLMAAAVCLSTVNTGTSQNVRANDDTVESTAIESFNTVGTFEDGSDLSKYVLSSVPKTNKIKSAEGDAAAYGNIYDFWSDEAISYTMTQTIKLEPGSYRLTAEAMGAAGMKVYVYFDGKISADCVSDPGWNSWKKTGEESVFNVTEEKDVSLGLYVDLQAGAWGDVDNIKLEKISDTDEKNVEALDNKDESGDSGDKKDDTEDDSDVVINNDITVAKVKNLSSDFIMGMDISSVISEFDSGVTYKDYDGNMIDNIDDFCRLLKANGVTHIRVRVWNNPYDADGNGYGGGNNDVEKAKVIASACEKAGLKMLVDFHCSDFWADPGKQQAPKEWKNMSLDEKTTAVKEYILNSLNDIDPDKNTVAMVQVGNETTTSFVGESSVEGMCKLFQSGSEAVKEFNNDTKVVIHVTNPEKGNVTKWAKNLSDNNVDYDIIATSYYPYWHGTLDNLKKEFETVKTTYGKDVMVAETSYAYTLNNSDGHDNTVRAGNNDTASTCTEPFTVQGQATSIRNLINAVNEAGGLGVFYWEPAWITVGDTTGLSGEDYDNKVAQNKKIWESKGSGWASSYAGEYDAKDAGKWYGGSAVDNEAMFYSDGTPTAGLKVWKYVRTGAKAVSLQVDSIEKVSGEIYINGDLNLPETINVSYSDGTKVAENVEWDLSDADNTKTGTYEITGTVEFSKEITKGDYAGMKSADIIYTLVVKNTNLVIDKDDASFEKWDNFKAEGSGIDNDSYTKGDSKTGKACVHWYSATPSSGTVTYNKTIKLEPGKYTFGYVAQGADGDELSAIVLDADGNIIKEGETTSTIGWNNWVNPSVTFTIDKETDVILQLGINIVAKDSNSGGWGTADDMYLYQLESITTDDTTKDDDSKPDDTKKDDETVKPDDTKKDDETVKPDDTKKDDETVKPDDTKKDDSTEKTDDTKKDDSTVKTDDAKKDDSTVKTDDAKKDNSTVKIDETKKDDSTVKTDETKKDDSAAKADDTKAVTTDTEKTDDKTAVQKQNDTTNTTEASKKSKEIVSENDSKIVLGDVNGILPASAKLSTEKVSDEKVINKVTSLVKDKINGVKDVVVYELDLTDGSTQLHQLDGKVQITMDMPFAISDNETIKVFRVDGDKLIPCASSIKDGRLVFETDHFSTYAFVKTADTQKKDVKAVSGGDNDMTVVWTFMIFAGVLIAFCSKKKKMN